MEALLASTFTVAIAEIGDKTQLLALILAARFKNKTAIILGILLSTLFNHFAAAWIGQWAINWVSPDLARYLVAASFFARCPVAAGGDYRRRPAWLDGGDERPDQRR